MTGLVVAGLVLIFLVAGAFTGVSWRRLWAGINGTTAAPLSPLGWLRWFAFPSDLPGPKRFLSALVLHQERADLERLRLLTAHSWIAQIILFVLILLALLQRP